MERMKWLWVVLLFLALIMFPKKILGFLKSDTHTGFGESEYQSDFPAAHPPREIQSDNGAVDTVGYGVEDFVKVHGIGQGVVGCGDFFDIPHRHPFGLFSCEGGRTSGLASKGFSKVVHKGMLYSLLRAQQPGSGFLGKIVCKIREPFLYGVFPATL